jgi:hypothetical protein
MIDNQYWQNKYGSKIDICISVLEKYYFNIYSLKSAHML